MVDGVVGVAIPVVLGHVAQQVCNTKAVSVTDLHQHMVEKLVLGQTNVLEDATPMHVLVSIFLNVMTLIGTWKLLYFLFRQFSLHII